MNQWDLICSLVYLQKVLQFEGRPHLQQYGSLQNYYSPIFQNYLEILRHPQFYTYALTGAIFAAGLYAYISGSPHVFMEIYKVTEQQYGWIFALIALGLIGASQINTIFLKSFTSEQIIRNALIIQSIIGTVLAGITYAGFSDLFVTIFLIFIFLSCQGFIFPNSSALSLATFGHKAGSASALLGAIQMCIGALASALVSILQSYFSPMTAIMAFCTISALSVFTLGRKTIIQQATSEAVKEEDIDMISTL